MILTRSRRPTASLFGRLLTLIGISVFASQTIILAMIFILPSPTPDFYRLSEVIGTLHGHSLPHSERRPLALKTADKPPNSGPDARDLPKVRQELVSQLHLDPDRVRALAYSRSLNSERRASEIARSQISREGGDPEALILIAPFEVAVQRADGRWDVVRPMRRLGLDPWQRRLLLWLLLSALVLAPVAYVFARRLAHPFRLFAEAAEQLGRDPRGARLPVSLKGTTEINVAVRAFNDMQDRLRRYVEDRTAMVGAIAHDLRTPLTRLRFRIEGVPEDVRAKMAADIDQMEEMIAAALTFVRDSSHPADRTPLELSSLLESVCDEMAETGFDIQVDRGDKVVLEGDPVALRRLLTNLLENAVKFGDRARARVYQDAANAYVEIEDDGPGIPPEDVERVFEPFYRREPSRSRQTGGIGLGLAVVRSVARGHGGDVVMINRQGGGLTARVQLPL